MLSPSNPALTIRLLTVLAGVAGGIGAALLLGRVVEGLLFGIRPRDPITFALVMAVLSVVAVISSYLPARRAAALDLTTALRQE